MMRLFVPLLLILSFLLSACRKDRVAMPAATTLSAIPDPNIPYTYTQATGRIAVPTISGVPFFAEDIDNAFWLFLQGDRLLPILGGVDTLGFNLLEFFDSSQLDVRRRTDINVRANGLTPITIPVEQRSFPFIFGNTSLGVFPSSSSTMLTTTTANILRDGADWTFNIKMQDTAKSILLPIYYRATNTNTLTYTRMATNTSDSLFYSLVANSTTPMPVFTTKDTTLTGNERFLVLQAKAKMSPMMPTPLALLRVRVNAVDEVSLRVQIIP